MKTVLWIAVAIALLVVAFRALNGAKKFGLANNILLAKYTLEHQTEENKALILERAKQILRRQSNEDWEPMESPYFAPWKYSLIALAMLELGISPALDGEKWIAPSKPLDIRTGDPRLELARRRLKRINGVDISL